MRWTNPIFAAAAAALLVTELQAVPAANLKENYQSIIERNPFGLKDPPPPATNAAPTAPKAKTEIFLTGVVSVGYPRLPKQAYFYTKEQNKKDATYYALSEGESKDGIKVVSIDTQLRKVRINMDDSETMLSFETHGVPVTAAMKTPLPLPGALPVPGQPGQPGQPVHQPGVQPLPMPAAPNAAARPTYDASGQAITTPNTGYQNAANPQTRQIPSRRIRGGGQPSDVMMSPGAGGMPQVQEQQAPRDPAEQYLRMHLNRTAQEREGVPLPPLPTFE